MFTAHCAVEQKQRRSPSRKFSEREFRELFPIIAVLVAIAVPLFVTGLQKAQRARDDANARAVKSAAIVYILNAKTTDENIYNTEDGKYVLHDYFSVKATVDQNGKIALTEIKGKDDSAYSATGDRVWYDIEATTVGDIDGWTITVYISSTDLDTDLS